MFNDTMTAETSSSSLPPTTETSATAMCFSLGARIVLARFTRQLPSAVVVSRHACARIDVILALVSLYVFLTILFTPLYLPPISPSSPPLDSILSRLSVRGVRRTADALEETEVVDLETAVGIMQHEYSDLDDNGESMDHSDFGTDSDFWDDADPPEWIVRTVNGETEDLSVGRSCTYDEWGDGWICRDCGPFPDDDAHMGGKGRGNGTGGDWDSRDTHFPLPRPRCKTLQPRGLCTPFRREGWDDPTPRVSTRFDPHASGSRGRPLARSVTHPDMIGEPYEQPDCSLTDPRCFDLSRCLGVEGGGMSITVYVQRNSTVGRRLVMAASALREDGEPRLIEVKDPKAACLILVFRDGLETRVGSLYELENWENGRNHLLWESNTFRDQHEDRAFPYGMRPAESYSHGVAMVANRALSDANLRVGYDLVLPLYPKWQRPNNSRANAIAIPNATKRSIQYNDITRPRKYLLSFRGSINPWVMPHYQHRYLAAEYWNLSSSSRDRDDVYIDVRCDPGGGNFTNYTASVTYSDVLLGSTFSFAPGGGGTTSYRFTEALSAGSIPVVTSDFLSPMYPEVDWNPCIVRVSEARVIDLPRSLREMPKDEVWRRRRACAKLYRGVIGHDARESYLPVTFKLAMRILIGRVQAAIKSSRVLKDINEMLMMGPNSSLAAGDETDTRPLALSRRNP